MTKKLERVQGSGNVFRDFGDPNPDIEQMKSLLAARFIIALDDRKLSVGEAKGITDITAADFSRIRRVKLYHFTIDRLAMILNKLDRHVDIRVSATARHKAGASPDQLSPALACLNI